MIFRSKTGAAFFEARYRQKADPWKFTQSDYEKGRFDTITAALAHRRYRRAFEPGCSIGTLTERLATLCDAVEASDFSPTAAARAAERCASLPNVTVSCAALTPKTRLGGFDLVLLSEIGFYFRPRAWRRLATVLVASMDPGTTVLASHWLGESRDHRQSGDQVHELLRAVPGLRLEQEQRHPGFRLDRLVRE